MWESCAVSLARAAIFSELEAALCGIMAIKPRLARWV